MAATDSGRVGKTRVVVDRESANPEEGKGDRQNAPPLGDGDGVSAVRRSWYEEGTDDPH